MFLFLKVEGMDVGISFNLTNVQGSLMLSPLDCGCSVKDIFIKLDGGASWLYQGYLFEYTFYLKNYLLSLTHVRTYTRTQTNGRYFDV